MIRIAVADDENIILNYYKDLFRSYREENAGGGEQEFEVSFYHSGEELLKSEDVGKLDVLLLDYYMGERRMNGIETAAAVRQQNQNVKIIFLCGSGQHALEAYRVKAWDYVLKNKITKASFYRGLHELLESFTVQPDKFVWRFNSEIEMIDLHDIMYVERVGRKNVIQTTTGARDYYATLSSVEEQLGTALFVRINRSAFVNVQYVSRISGEEVLMKDGKKFYISSKNYRIVKNQILLRLSAKK